MSEHFTKDSTERYLKFNEELGESVQALSKLLSHGAVAVTKLGSYDNKKDLTNEIGDVLVAIELLVNHGDIDREQLVQRMVYKRPIITDYMRHQFSEPVYNYSLLINNSVT